MRWGMVIDVTRCVGCQTCTIACKQEHGLPPETAWRWVADCEVGEYPDVRRLFLPMQCMHCASPPCVPVCPPAPRASGRMASSGSTPLPAWAAATARWRALHARHLVQSATGSFDTPTLAERAQARPERQGVMTKCTFCKERVDGGLGRGLVPGVDPDATPMCAVACIAGAITFGDLDDEASKVSRLSKSDRAQVLLPECGTAPRVYYLAD